MIILFDSIFGHNRIVYFILVEWIKKIAKSVETVREGFGCAFPMPAIPTRHEVTCKPKGENICFFKTSRYTKTICKLQISHQSRG